MECPRCKQTSTTLIRVDHIYPVKVLGMPAFWKWVSPALARAILNAMLAVCAAILALTVLWFVKGPVIFGAISLVLFLFVVSIFIRCAGAMKHYQRKEVCRCDSCGLEWSQAPAGENP
jgi:hypothetical protein